METKYSTLENIQRYIDCIFEDIIVKHEVEYIGNGYFEHLLAFYHKENLLYKFYYSRHGITKGICENMPPKQLKRLEVDSLLLITENITNNDSIDPRRSD